MTKQANRRAFTLIELMIVVAIIGILAAVAVVKFAGMMAKAREASVKGNLTSIRSALHIYYTDSEGIFPSTGTLADCLTTGGKYMNSIPGDIIAQPNAHLKGNGIRDVAGAVDDGALSSNDLWFYAGSATGRLTVNCTHADSRSTVWSAY
jgi:prepilin-type N-terminal cleavage/methylation domain-containing protein